MIRAAPYVRSALLLMVTLTACQPDPQSQTDMPVTAETPTGEAMPASTSQALTLSEDWVLDGFDAPESVIRTPDGEAYYVSNVGGEGTNRDNDGAISLVSSIGTMIARDWVTGTPDVPLHAPKGMTLVENDKGMTLLVTDIDHVAFIVVGEDVADNGRLAKRLPAPGATFLNDIAKGPGETAFISDSANARLYRLENDTITVWLEDDRLDGVNGLQMDGDRLLVTTMSAGTLLSVDLDTKTITTLARGMQNADGIGLRTDGSYIVSSWPGQLWHVREGEAPVLMQDTSGETDAVLMNDILLVDDATLVTPNWMPGTVRGYVVQ